MAALSPSRFNSALKKIRGGAIVALFFIGALFCPAVHSEWKITASSDSLLHSSNIAAKAFFTDWRAPHYGGNHTSIYNYNLLKIQRGRLHLAYVQRQQLLLGFSSDTAELVKRTHRKQALPVGKTYQIHLQSNALQAHGPQFGWQFIHTDKLLLTAAISFYQATQPLYGKLHGTVRVLSEKDYEYENINIDYIYDKDYLFDRDIGPGYGLGQGFELQLQWRLNRFYQLDAQVNDINAAIYWNQIAGTRARLSSDTKSYDENGYVRISPGFSGRHYSANRRQPLPWHGQARMLLRASPALQYMAQWQYLNEQLYFSLGMIKPGPGFSYMLAYELSSASWQLGLSHRLGSLRIAADHYRWQALRMASIQLQLTVLQF